jgi:hypothetical protein
MMQQPIQYGAGHLFIVKHINPSGEFDVGGDNQAFSLVTFNYELKEQLRSGSV